MIGIESEAYLSSQEDARKILTVAQEDGTAETASRRGTPTILVVDDQQLLADTTALVLNRSGFRAERAYSGHSALEMALQLRPDYLLTDILMPGMNGVELAIAVRKELPATTIILISGQAGITEIVQHAQE